MREVLLFRRHFLEGKSLALAWNEVPVEPFVVVQRIRGPGGLFRRQRRQKIVCGRGHFLRDGAGIISGMRPGRKTGQLRRENEDQEASGGVHATKSRQAAKKRKPKISAACRAATKRRKRRKKLTISRPGGGPIHLVRQ